MSFKVDAIARGGTAPRRSTWPSRTNPPPRSSLARRRPVGDEDTFYAPRKFQARLVSMETEGFSRRRRRADEVDRRQGRHHSGLARRIREADEDRLHRVLRAKIVDGVDARRVSMLFDAPAAAWSRVPTLHMAVAADSAGHLARCKSMTIYIIFYVSRLVSVVNGAGYQPCSTL